MARPGLEPEANPEGERGPRFEPGEPGWRDPDSNPRRTPEGERGPRFEPGEPGWRDPDSNRGHHDFQSCALPAELSRRGAGSDASAGSTTRRPSAGGPVAGRWYGRRT